jgi:CHASE3 domain sensor protein
VRQRIASRFVIATFVLLLVVAIVFAAARN